MSTALVAEKAALYQFDEYTVDPARRLLLRGLEPIPLTPKAFAVLLVLLENRGEVVEKEELIRRVWADSFVTEANLTQNISAVRKALGEKANDRRYVVTLPGRGYSFVAPVIELPAEEGHLDRRAAARRPAGLSSKEIPIPVFPATPAPAAAARRRRRWLLGAIAAAAIAVAAVGAAVLSRAAFLPFSGEELSLDPALRQRRSIAVLGFRNLSGQPGEEWLSSALAEMLATELSAGTRMRVVSGENLARAERSFQADGTGALSPERLGRLHGILGSDLLVVGSYLPLGERAGRQIRVDLRVLKIPEGETVASLAEVGTEPELFDLVSRTGGRLRQTLGIAELQPAQVQGVEALRPASPEAARLYAEGVARLRSSDPGSLELLRRASGADPESALIRSALSQSWSELGYDARALEEGRKAVELAGSLPQETRLVIEARFHEAARRWDRASEIYRSLWTFFPDDVDHGLKLAACLMKAGRGSEGMTVLAALRELPPPAGEDARIDLLESQIARRLADLATQRQAAAAAVEKGRRSGEEVLVARALIFHGDALRMAGKPAEALALFTEAREISRRAGHVWLEGMALANIARSFHARGDLAGAEKTARESLAIAERIGTAVGMASEFLTLGLIHRDRGELEEALRSLEESRRWAVEMGDRLSEARTLSIRGEILASQGSLTEAREIFERVASLSRAVGNRADEAGALGELGTLLAWQGDLAQARRYHEQAFGILLGLQDSTQAASMLAFSAEAVARLGDLGTAERRLDQALNIKWRAGNRLGVAQVQGTLSWLAWEKGDLDTARTLAEAQLRTARETGALSLEGQALLNLGHAALAAGDLPRARASFQRALEAGDRSGAEITGTAARLGLARLALAEERAGRAAGLAQEAAEWYRARTMPGEEARASAVLAEARLRQGRIADARRAAERARALAERSQDRELRFAVAAPVARVEAAAGNRRATGDLRRLAEEASRSGFALWARTISETAAPGQRPAR